MSLNIAKSIVHVRNQDLCEESKSTIFGFYLDWFFGNTENPFSKEVRLATQLLVQLSVFLMETANSTNSNKVSWGKMVQVYEGICLSSPRTVKSTKDILELWLFEVRNVLADQRYAIKGGVQRTIGEFISKNRVYYDPVLVQTLENTVSSKAPLIFIRHPSLTQL